MNPVLGSVFLGRTLAEGDYLGALPYLPDLLKSIKAAAPNLIREVASKQLEKVQRKLSPMGTLPVVVSAAPAPAALPTEATAAPARPSWIIPATFTLGGLILFYVAYKRAKRR